MCRRTDRNTSRTGSPRVDAYHEPGGTTAAARPVRSEVDRLGLRGIGQQEPHTRARSTPLRPITSSSSTHEPPDPAARARSHCCTTPAHTGIEQHRSAHRAWAPRHTAPRGHPVRGESRSGHEQRAPATPAPTVHPLSLRARSAGTLPPGASPPLTMGPSRTIVRVPAPDHPTADHPALRHSDTACTAAPCTSMGHDPHPTPARPCVAAVWRASGSPRSGPRDRPRLRRSCAQTRGEAARPPGSRCPPRARSPRRPRGPRRPAARPPHRAPATARVPRCPRSRISAAR